ncbi:MAG TPA: cupredoxin domain-containing protein [Actinomycetota bacterium]|nr:cupredoxin domain-containing protein [Actinomycetota bacterium]
MTEAQETGTRPRWTDLATLGFALSGLGPLLLLIAVLAWGLDTEGETGFFAAIIGIAVVGAVVVRLKQTWTKVVAIVLALMLFMGLWWTIFGLFAGPSSFFDFMSGVLVMPGALLALIASALSFVARRRGRLGAKPVGGERKTIRTAITVVALAAVVSGILTVTSRSTVDDASAAELTVILKDFEFAPTDLSVTGGSEVLVRNDDPFFHTFTIDQLEIDEALTLGSEKLITIPAEPGTYILYCKPHTADPDRPDPDDMAATLRIT